MIRITRQQPACNQVELGRYLYEIATSPELETSVILLRLRRVIARTSGKLMYGLRVNQQLAKCPAGRTSETSHSIDLYVHTRIKFPKLNRLGDCTCPSASVPDSGLSKSW